MIRLLFCLGSLGLVGCTSQNINDAAVCLKAVQDAQATSSQPLNVIVASLPACAAFIVDLSNGVISVVPKNSSSPGVAAKVPSL